ncbi:MAG TPA: YibE/F family protein [Propionibacteriaceae bacterium]|nr:YibE/F family protein [Propionibacteriaceae bacterium]
MAHHHIAEQATAAADALRSRRTLRTLVWILIPLAIWTVAALVWLWPHNVSAHLSQDNTTVAVPGLTIPKGTVTAVTETNCDAVSGSATGDGSKCGQLTVRLDEGPEKGQSVQVTVTAAVYASGVTPGTGVTLYRTPIKGGEPGYQFADFQRTLPMVALAILFVAAVIAVARWRGALAVAGLAFSGFILTQFMFPALIVGHDPVLVGLVGSSAIMFVVLYTTHGFSARTTTALVGTLFGLLLSAFLGWGATKWAHLTGVASEDDVMLSATAPDLTLTSVVICGVIIAGLGVLNDVTITQASAVWELAGIGGQSPRDLFVKAMRIGRDHIASSVYTILFASAGAIMSVLLLLTVYERPLFSMLLREQFAGEVVRSLVGSIGLVLSVPVTTAVAVAVVAPREKPIDKLGERTVDFEDDELYDIGDEGH